MSLHEISDAHSYRFLFISLLPMLVLAFPNVYVTIVVCVVIGCTYEAGSVRSFQLGRRFAKETQCRT